jgi:hypothetical protein
MLRKLPTFILCLVAALIVVCLGILFDVNFRTPAALSNERYSFSSVDSLMHAIRPAQPPPIYKTLVTIFLAFCIPPLPFIHTWLLAQVYRYAFQPGERRGWYNLSMTITAVISVCAAASIAIWLADLRVTFIRIVGVMTALCVVLGAGGAVWIARKRQFSNRFTLLLALAAGLVSLVVPFGVVGVYTTWPIVLTGVIGYLIIRRNNERRLERDYAMLTNWQIDSLSLGGMALVAASFIVVVPIWNILIARRYDYSQNVLVYVGVLSLILSFIMSAFTRRHLTGLALKKKNDDAAATTGRFFWHWLWAMVAWGCSSAMAAAIIFYGQMMAHSVFMNMFRSGMYSGL